MSVKTTDPKSYLRSNLGRPNLSFLFIFIFILQGGGGGGGGGGWQLWSNDDSHSIVTVIVIIIIRSWCTGHRGDCQIPLLFELYWYVMCRRLINSTATTMNLLLSLWMTLSSRASSWLLLCSYFYFEDNYYCLLYIPNYSVNDDRKIRKPTRHQRDDIS